MRAIVTGGAGFIGSHIVDLLVKRKAAVTVVDNFCTGRMENIAALSDQIRIENFDLATENLDPILRAGHIDTIIHAAGNASIPLSIADPLHDLKTNIVTTQNLLESVRRVAPSANVVNISTAATYAEGSDSPMSENYPQDPASPYGITKLAAELYVKVYARIHGLKTANVRVFSTFGPRLRKQVVWDFMERLTNNPKELVIQGDGEERRDPSHVKNAALAIVLVAEKAPMLGEAYNFGSGDSVSITQLARDIGAAMGLDPAIRHNGERGKGHARTWRANISRLTALGYEPEVGYHEGLADTASWFKSIQRDRP